MTWEKGFKVSWAKNYSLILVLHRQGLFASVGAAPMAGSHHNILLYLRTIIISAAKSWWCIFEMCQVTCLVGFFLAYSLTELAGRSSWSTNIMSRVNEKHQPLTNSKETNVHDLEPADGDWGLVGRFCSGVLHLRGVQGSCWLCNCWGWGGWEEDFSLKCK